MDEFEIDLTDRQSNFRKKLAKFLSDKLVSKRYVAAGKAFAHLDNQCYIEEVPGYDVLLDNWFFWEGQYASRGYMPISREDFAENDSKGKSIDDLVDVKLADGKKSVLHAADCKLQFYYPLSYADIVKERQAAVESSNL